MDLFIRIDTNPLFNNFVFELFPTDKSLDLNGKCDVYTDIGDGVLEFRLKCVNQPLNDFDCVNYEISWISLNETVEDKQRHIRGSSLNLALTDSGFLDKLASELCVFRYGKINEEENIFPLYKYRIFVRF